MCLLHLPQQQLYLIILGLLVLKPRIRNYNETGAKDDPFIRNEQIDVSKIHHETAAKNTRLAGLPPPTGTSHTADSVPMFKTASDDQQHNDYCLQRTNSREKRSPDKPKERTSFCSSSATI